MAKTTFGRHLSVESFIKEKGMTKIFFNGMCVKGSQEPAYFNDENGNPTTIRRVAIQNQDKETVAFLSSELSEKYWKDKASVNSDPIQFVETTTEQVNPVTAEVETNTSWVLCRENTANVDDMSAIFGL